MNFIGSFNFLILILKKEIVSIGTLDLKKSIKCFSNLKPHAAKQSQRITKSVQKPLTVNLTAALLPKILANITFQ